MTKPTGVGRGNNPASHVNRPSASKQHRWKPWSRIGSNGYVKIRVGRSHPLSDPNGWTYEHLVVWVSAGNSRPSTGEILHHRNEDRTDNRIENLHLMSRSDHNRLHNDDKGRDPRTDRIVGKRRAGRLLDGKEHNEFPR